MKNFNQKKMSKIALLLPVNEPGVSAKQFVQVYSVCSTVFQQVDILTYKAQKPIFDHKVPFIEELLLTMKPLDVHKLDPIKNDYQGLVVPDGQGTLLV